MWLKLDRIPATETELLTRDQRNACVLQLFCRCTPQELPRNLRDAESRWVHFGSTDVSKAMPFGHDLEEKTHSPTPSDTSEHQATSNPNDQASKGEAVRLEIL
ncbi:MAG: hypothetical protein ACFCD0_21680 [Gemmataceae bacterium]